MIAWREEEGEGEGERREGRRGEVEREKRGGERRRGEGGMTLGPCGTNVSSA